MNLNFNLTLKYISHLFFILYFSICAYYTAERVIYVDTAFQYLTVIQTEFYQFFTDRYGNILAQTIPLIGIKLHLPIKSIIYLISLSYPIIYYAAFLFCYKLLKQKVFAFIIPVSLVLCTGTSFFFAINETTQGLVYSTVYFCWLLHTKDKMPSISSILIEILILLLCIFTHPITSFTIGYSIISLWLLKIINIKRVILSGGLFIIPILIKLSLNSSTGYEAQYLNNLIDYKDILPSFFSLQGVKFLTDSFMGKNDLYFFPLLLLFLSSAWLLFKRKYTIVLFTIFWTVLFIFLSVIASSKGHDSLFMEIRFLPLSFFIGVILIAAIKEVENRSIKFAALLSVFVIVLIRIPSIVKFSSFASERTDYIEKVCLKNIQKDSSKFICNIEDLNKKKLRGEWAFGAETLLYSSAFLDKQMFITPIKDEDLTPQGFDLKSKKIFICPYSNITWNIDSLNRNYFDSFEEDYIKLNKSEL